MRGFQLFSLPSRATHPPPPKQKPGHATNGEEVEPLNKEYASVTKKPCSKTTPTSRQIESLHSPRLIPLATAQPFHSIDETNNTMCHHFDNEVAGRRTLAENDRNGGFLPPLMTRTSVIIRCSCDLPNSASRSLGKKSF